MRRTQRSPRCTQAPAQVRTQISGVNSLRVDIPGAFKMANGFRPPSYMSDAQLSKSVQPSWGTILGQSMGKGVELMLGNWQKRMERSRQEASALQKQRELLGYKHELGRPERERKAALAKSREGRAINQETRAVAGEARKTAQHKQSIKTAEQLGKIRTAAQQTAKEKKARDAITRDLTNKVDRWSEGYSGLVIAAGGNNKFPKKEMIALIRTLPEDQQESGFKKAADRWVLDAKKGVGEIQKRRIAARKAGITARVEASSEKDDDDAARDLIKDQLKTGQKHLIAVSKVRTWKKTKENDAMLAMFNKSGITTNQLRTKAHKAFYTPANVQKLNNLLVSTADRATRDGRIHLQVGYTDPKNSIPSIVSILKTAEAAGMLRGDPTLDDILGLVHMNWGPKYSQKQVDYSGFVESLAAQGIRVMLPFDGDTRLLNWRKVFAPYDAPVAPVAPPVRTTTTSSAAAE